MALTTVTVVAHRKTVTGTFPSGKLRIWPSIDIRDMSDNLIYSGEYEYVYDALGNVTFDLPAVDDPDLRVGNFTYWCEETIDNEVQPRFQFQVKLTDAPTKNFESLVPLEIAPNVVYNLQQGVQGLKGDKGDPGDLVPSDFGSIWSGSVSVLPVAADTPATRYRVLSGNVVVSNGFTAQTATKSFIVTYVIKQASAGTGPFTADFSGIAALFPGGVAPVMPSTADSELHIAFFWSGRNWKAFLLGSFA